MANTDPVAAFKLDLTTLDNLRAALLRDHEVLTRYLRLMERRRERVRMKAADAQPLTTTEEEQVHAVARQHFQSQNLLRFFEVNEELVKAAEVRAETRAVAAG